ncbi:MAG: M56 family metallopeptidase, partial [Pirellulaceae bacterium]
MTLFVLTLGQLTLLLVLAIAVSGILSRNASRAHRVLLFGLLCVVIMPLFSWSADQMGWGLITPPVQPAERSALAIPDSLQTDAALQPSTPTETTSSPASPQQELAHSAAMNHQTPGMTAEPPAVSVGPETQTAPARGAALPGPPITPATSIAAEAPWYSAVPWWMLLGVAWAAGSAWLLLRLIIGGWSALRITRTSQPVTDAALQLAISRACRDLGVTRPVQLRKSGRIQCPVISGWGQPMIIIPTKYNKELDWGAILTHELAHWKRRDHWSALLAESTRCLLPWHPLVHYCCYRMYRLSEIACDAWAVRFADGPEKFAESLIAFTPNPRRPGFSSMATRHSNIRERVSLILSESGRTPRAGSAFTAVIAALAMMSVLLTGMLRTHAPADPSDVSNVDSPIIAESESAEPGEDKTDEEWVEHLTSVPETARWFVGKNLGVALAQLPEGRGFRILESCWDDIQISVRKQILKGYYPHAEINSHFFQVMNLGMSSPDSGSRSFAATYIEGVIHRNFESDLDGYRQWYETTTGMLADEIVASDIQTRLDEAKDPATRNVHGLISNILEHQTMFVEMRIARATLLDGGIEDLLAAWQDEGFLAENHDVFGVIKRARERTNTPGESQESAGLSLESSDAEWIAHLTSIPNEARWNVGAGMGATMSRMQGDRPLQILRACWNEIGPDVRRQIMKGFTPGFFVESLHANYFEILELGMRSPEPSVQDTARTYLEWITLEKFATAAQYESWREATQGTTYEQLMAQLASEMVDELDGGDPIQLETLLKKISEGSRHSPVFKRAIVEAGLTAKLDLMLRNGQIPFANPVIGTLLNALPISPQAMRVALEAELKKMVEMWEASVADNEDASELRSDLWTIAMNLGETKYPYIIPTMIGLIDADNSYDTVYGVGYFGLSDVTGVSYRKYHDGAWWRRWWEENKETLP